VSPHIELPRPATRSAVVGVLNVTPDSFSDGGRYTSLDQALAHGRQLWAEGADLIDVGGESTRPGADRVDAAEEIRRVLPAIRELSAQGIAVSVDTMRAAVAEAAIEAGAAVVNDVSGGLADPAMLRVVAGAGVPVILMHWRGHSRDMLALAKYDDVVADVLRELTHRVEDALAAGVAPDRLVIDPGLGFAKTAAARLRGDRLPGAGRDLAQVVPRLAAHRPGRRAPPGRRARGCHGRHYRDRRVGRRLGRARARGPPERGRAAGRRRAGRRGRRRR
jgi:dihydropteroate synthase